MPQATQSFAKEVKEEIAKASWSDELKRSLLSSFVKINGGIRISNGVECLELTSESSSIAKALYTYISDLYGVNVHFAYTRGIGAKSKVKYHVLIDEASYILGDLEVDFLSYKVPKNAVATEDLTGAYMAGAFLASGSVNSPASSNYHLEIAFNDEKFAKWFSKALNKAQSRHFSSKVTQRRKQWVCYLKKSEEIADFLIYIGATSSCLKFEDVRINRDYKNSLNRLSNLDSANFSKTMEAAQRQVKEIRYILGKDDGKTPINYKMRLLMDMRLEHEDASLDELSEMMSEELASTVTKSNINHLFRAIHALYMKEMEDEQ